MRPAPLVISSMPAHPARSRERGFSMAISEVVKHASRRSLEEMAIAGQSAKGSLKRARDKARETMGEVVQTMEAGTAAFGFGWARGRYATEGELEVFGVPVDLATGLGLKALAFAEQFDRYDQDASAFGQGALDAWLTSQGVRFGMEAKAKAAAPAAAGYQSAVSASDVAREMARSAGAVI